MEFGNLQDKLYILIPFAILGIVIYGVIKKNRILNALNLKRGKAIEIFKGIFLLLGTIFVVIALLSPEKIKDGEKIKKEGVDFYIIFDVSNSMLGEDVFPSRLERGKRVVGNILNNLKGDRVGFIPFSDTAYIQMPLTDDYEMGKNYLGAIDTTLISGGGTELLAGLKIANHSFIQSGAIQKNVIIISDGGEKDNQIKEYIVENKLNVYTIGVGTDDGSTLPLLIKGKKQGFIKNKEGEVVVSKLNRALLKDIGIGGYFEVNNLEDTTGDLLKKIDELEKGVIRESMGRATVKYFQYPLFLGLILILLGYFLRGGVKNEK